MKKQMRVVGGLALSALLALSVIASTGAAFSATKASDDTALTSRGKTQGVTWETGLVSRGKTQGVTWEGVTWE